MYSHQIHRSGKIGTENLNSLLNVEEKELRQQKERIEIQSPKQDNRNKQQINVNELKYSVKMKIANVDEYVKDM